MSEEPTNAVLLERLNNFIEENKADHSRIEEQTKKTNGHVASLIKWRAYLTGGLAVLTSLCVPVLIWALNNWNK